MAPGSRALSADCLAGGHEEEAMIHAAGAAPHGAIAPARFLWQPVAGACLATDSERVPLPPNRLLTSCDCLLACKLPATSRDCLISACVLPADTSETGIQTLSPLSSLGQASPPGHRVVWVWVHPAAVQLVEAQVSLLVGRLSLAVLCVNLRCRRCCFVCAHSYHKSCSRSASAPLSCLTCVFIVGAHRRRIFKVVAVQQVLRRTQQL